MELRDYVRVLRKHWRLIALCTLVAVGVAAGLSLRTPKEYQSTTEMFVSTNGQTDANTAYTGSLFSQQRVISYANIVSGPLVAQAAAARLNGVATAGEVQAEVAASAVPNTVLLNVTVTDRSPARAQQIAEAVGAVFPQIAAQIENTSAARVGSPVKVSVVRPATFSAAPVSPKPVRNSILALVVGLLLGVGLAVLRETLDTTIKDPEELSTLTTLPVLGAIAYDSDAPKRPLIVHADPKSSRAEAFRQLRTNLQFVNIDRTPRSIVVTSSVPEEGKTTTAINLAIALAQSGMRVLLVEADLRRSRMTSYLGIEGAVGLTSVLIGRATLSDAIQPWGPDTLLHVLPAGPTPPNPSELLGSQATADLIRELEVTYDLVLIDAPPLLPVTDAAVLSTTASGAVLVVRYGRARREQVQRAVESLRSVEATVYGAVLTMTPTRGPDSYYYGYGYRYETRSKRAGLELVRPEPRVGRRPDADGDPTADGEPPPLQPAEHQPKDPLEYFLS